MFTSCFFLWTCSFNHCCLDELKLWDESTCYERSCISFLQWTPSWTSFHLVLDTKLLCEAVQADSPTLACWEAPGCPFFHLSAQIHPHRQTVPGIQKRESLLFSPLSLNVRLGAHISFTWRQNCRDSKSVTQMIWAFEALKSFSPYLVLLLPADGLNVWLQTLLSLPCCTPAPYAQKTGLQFIFLYVNTRFTLVTDLDERNHF